MAFSILCSMVGALVVSQLGLLQYKAPQKLEKIVFDPAGLTAIDESAHRVEAAHIAIRELLAAQEAEARRQASMPLETPVEKEAAEPRARATLQDKKKAVAPKRELAAVPAPVPAPVAAPLVITPVIAEQAVAERTDTKDNVLDKLTAGVSKIRDFIVNTVRIDKPLSLPFEGASASSGAISAMDGLQSRMKLPTFGM